MEIITLSNGKKVANFSSPHPFTFTDGSILPAVSPSEAKRLKVTFIEEELPGDDIKLSFELSDSVLAEMDKWVRMKHNDEVHVVFCPLPMITAIKAHPGYGEDYLLRKDRKSTRLNSSH